MKTIDKVNCFVGALATLLGSAALVVSIRSCQITMRQTEMVQRELRLSEDTHEAERTINLRFSVSGDRGQILSWEPVDPQFVLTDLTFYSFEGDLNTGNGGLGYYGERPKSIDLSSTLGYIIDAHENVDYDHLFVMRELSKEEAKTHYIPALQGYFPICADITYNYQGQKIERSMVIELYYNESDFEPQEGDEVRFRHARVGRVLSRSVGCERPLREEWRQWARIAFLSYASVPYSDYNVLEVSSTPSISPSLSPAPDR